MHAQNNHKRTVRGAVTEVHDFAKKKAHSVRDAYANREEARIKGFLKDAKLPPDAFDAVVAATRKNAVTKETVKEAAIISAAIIAGIAVLKEIL